MNDLEDVLIYIHLYIVYVCLHTTVIEFSSYNRDHMAHSA